MTSVEDRLRQAVASLRKEEGEPIPSFKGVHQRARRRRMMAGVGAVVVAVAAAFRDEVGYEPPVSTPVMFDSGVRDATDVVIALALGATAVGIGRPYAYALSYGGAASLTHFLKSFLAEFNLCLAVCGFKDIAALKEAGCEPALH